MKRLIWIVSTAVTIAAGIYLIHLTQTWNVAETSATATPFASFAPGQVRTLEFDWASSSLRHLTDREHRDQALDWIFLGVLSQSGLTPQEFNQATFDIPPARVGYMQAVAAFEYGPTRSRSLGHGQVIAIVPEESAEQRTLTLAHVADEHRKNTGRIPKTLVLFEYRLDPEWSSARIVRLSDVDGATLYTENAGYHETRISNQSDLRQFLGATNDLTYLTVKDGQLVAGGRALGPRQRHMAVDDVAALWQSEKSLREAQDEVEAFNAKWRSRTYRTESEKAALDYQYQQEKKALESRMSPERRVSSSGFSLDPTFDYDGLAAVLRLNQDRLKSLTGASDEEIEKIVSGLQQRNDGPLYDFLDHLRKEKGERLAAGLDQAIKRYSFQAARYDGSLRGTQVGMTLFYTDLVAKLKALEFWSNTPVEDFRPLTRVRLSPVFKREIEEHSSTRLWFGTQDRGFQGGTDQILFARNATRIYAASANLFTPGKEVEPNAESAEFLGWWNNHYEEVARYEPEYDRLNQIMKWSLALAWLRQHGNFEQLEFLETCKVDHSNWFPNWARNNPRLKFTDWNRVSFYPPNYKGSKTEALPLLKSAGFESFGEVTFIEGGVSLAEEDLFKNRALLPSNISEGEETVLRSGLNYNSFAPGETKAITTLEQTKYEFQDTNIISHARDKAKFIEPQSELRNVSLERSFAKSGGDVQIDVKLGETPFGRFSTSATQDVIRVRFQELELDRAHDIGEEISGAIAHNETPEAVLASRGEVESFVALDCDHCYLVKFRGSDRWAKYAPEGTPRVDLAEGWDARAAGMEDNAPTMNIAMLDDQNFTREMQSTKYVRFEAGAREKGGSVMRLSNRGPPSGSTPTQIHVGGATIEADLGPDGTLYIWRDRIPESLQKDGQVLIASLEDARDPSQRLARELQHDQVNQVLNDIVKDPINAKRQLDDFGRHALEDADRALAAGDDVLARHRVEGLMAMQGRSPDLLTRMAISDLHTRPEIAVGEIREALHAPVPMQPGIFNTINERLASGDLSPYDRINLERMAAILDLRRAQQAAHLQGDIIPVFDRGVVDFHVRLSEPLPTSAVAPHDAAGKSGPWYVLDDRSLALNDPAVRIRIANDVLAGRDLGRTVQLPRWDVAHFRPEVIETANGQRWVRVTPMPIPTAPAYQMYQANNNCPSGMSDSCEPYPYLAQVGTPN